MWKSCACCCYAGSARMLMSGWMTSLSPKSTTLIAQVLYVSSSDLLSIPSCSLSVLLIYLLIMNWPTYSEVFMSFLKSASKAPVVCNMVELITIEFMNHVAINNWLHEYFLITRFIWISQSGESLWGLLWKTLKFTVEENKTSFPLQVKFWKTCFSICLKKY